MNEEEKQKNKLELIDDIYSLEKSIKDTLETFESRTGLKVKHVTVYGHPDGEMGDVKISVGVT